jgi:hypothetical protein
VADKEAKYPLGSNLSYPDGSLYVYIQASEDFEPGVYADLNANQRLCKYRGGLRIPPIVITETLPKEWYSFVSSA